MLRQYLEEQNLKEAMGDGIWLSFIEGKIIPNATDSAAFVHLYNDMQLCQQMGFLWNCRGTKLHHEAVI